MPRTSKLLFLLLLVFMLIPFSVTLSAQTQNLLVNPSFEQGGDFPPYTASMGDPNFNFAQGWAGWLTQTPRNFDWQNVKIDAYPHSGQYKVSGNYSQDMGRSGGTFTAAAYQIVNGIANGTTLQATAKVLMENGTGTGARVRIGIGSNVAGDPTSPAIVWSSFFTTPNAWQQISVETTVPAGSVTIFIYATQDTPNGPLGPNKVYIDDAGLFVTGAGTPIAPTGANGTVAVPVVPTSTPAQALAAFVSAQGTIENGKIVHTVVSGDTLAAISVAYGVPLATLRDQNNIVGSILFVGQKIIIKDAPTATPVPTRAAATATRASGGGLVTNTPLGSAGFVSPTRTTGTTNAPSPIVGNATVIAALATATTVPASATPRPTQAPTERPTDIPTEEATAEPTQVPTEEATEEPTLAPSNTVEPTLANTPINPSDAPTAPVTTGQNADPLATTASVCVMMFDDVNQNRIQNSGEALLAGGVITLRQGATDVTSYQTNGASEPYCFEDLEPGSYTAVAVAPDGYGLTTPASLVISLQAGTSFRLQFGAAQGVVVAVAPTANAQTDSTQPELNQAVAPGGTDGVNLGSVAGILVIGGAVVLLIGGAVVYFIVRRLD
jgi:LysM repeat protein